MLFHRHAKPHELRELRALSLTSVIVFVIVGFPADDSASAATQGVDGRKMLLSLPLRVHLLRCVEDGEMAHAEVVDAGVVSRIWAVHRELGIKSFPVHWTPAIRVCSV